MRLRSDKFVRMYRQSGNSSPRGVPPPQNNIINAEEQPIEMIVSFDYDTRNGDTANTTN